MTHRKNELNRMDKAWALLDRAPSIKVSSDFNARFWARIQEKEHASLLDRIIPEWIQNTAYLAGVWAGVVLLFFLYTNQKFIPSKQTGTQILISEFTGSEDSSSINTAYFSRASKTTYISKGGDAL